MCGIAGRVNQSAPIDRDEIFRMTELIAHRGPDDHGYHLRTARRASAIAASRIIDLAGGHQPLANEDGTVWIVFNGEIYNHARAAPRADRARPPLPHPLRHRGDRPRLRGVGRRIARKRLRGMFAFAIWDERAQRPAAGARPPRHQAALLRAARRRPRLRLRDQVAARASRASTARVDDDALSAYLALRYVPAPLTMFRGVKKLPPASILTWHGGLRRRIASLLGSRRRRHARRRAADRSRRDRRAARARRPGHQAAPHVRGAGRRLPLGRPRLDHDHRRDAARRRRARRAQDLLGRLRRRRHAVRRRARLRAAGRRRARHRAPRGARHRCARPPTRCPRSSGTSTSRSPIPPACRSTSCRARAQEQVTVVLSGEGADEALGGYYIYRRMASSRRCASARRRRRRALSFAGELLVARAARTSCAAPARLFGRPLERLVPRRRRAPSTTTLARSCTAASDAQRRRHRAVAACAALGSDARHDARCAACSISTARVWLPDDLLVKADKMTMAHAIELRVPFLDHELMEHAWSLPDRLKIDNGVGKALLRKAARRPRAAGDPRRARRRASARRPRRGCAAACTILRTTRSPTRARSRASPSTSRVVRSLCWRATAGRRRSARPSCGRCSRSSSGIGISHARTVVAPSTASRPSRYRRSRYAALGSRHRLLRQRLVGRPAVEEARDDAAGEAQPRPVGQLARQPRPARHRRATSKRIVDKLSKFARTCRRAPSRSRRTSTCSRRWRFRTTARR